VCVSEDLRSNQKVFIVATLRRKSVCKILEIFFSETYSKLKLWKRLRPEDKDPRFVFVHVRSEEPSLRKNCESDNSIFLTENSAVAKLTVLEASSAKNKCFVDYWLENQLIGL
jgi:hypothetical protein